MKSTTEAAALVGANRRTVEREIKRGNLTAELHRGRYLIADDEAARWAAQFQMYATQRRAPNPAECHPNGQASRA